MINKVITTFVTLLSALAIALPAVAGKHVNWKDDGTVDLIHEDGTVINITREHNEDTAISSRKIFGTFCNTVCFRPASNEMFVSV